MTTLGFAVSAAALVAAGPGLSAGAQDSPEAGRAGHAGSAGDTWGAGAGRPARKGPGVDLVVAPVRIADVATVRLLRPGDRVDVVAAGDPPGGGDGGARVLARGARVTDVPGLPDPRRAGAAPDAAGVTGVTGAGMDGASTPGDGALVLLSVPRPTAARLVGAAVTSRLAVTLC